MRIFARILRQEARYSCCLDGVRDIAELHARVHLLRVCGLGVQTLVSGCISGKTSDFEQVAVTSSSIKSGGSIYVSVLLWNLIYICMLSRFSHISFFATLWTVARLAPVHGILQAGILEWVPFPSPGDLPEQEIKCVSPESPACRWILYPLSHLGSSLKHI